MKIGSWIVRDKFTGLVICEIFNPSNVERVNASARYEAIPILDYLVELNRQIKVTDS